MSDSGDKSELKEDVETPRPDEEAVVPDEDMTASLPEDAMIILPVRRMVLFPGTVLPITIGRPKSLSAAQAAMRDERPIVIAMQRDSKTFDPSIADLYEMGTAASIWQYSEQSGNAHTILCRGLYRVRLIEEVSGFPFLAARVETVSEVEEKSPALEARFVQLKQRAAEALDLLPGVSDEIRAAVANAESPGGLADLVASYMDLESAERQDILGTMDLGSRIDKVLSLLSYRIEVLRLSRNIEQQTKETLSEQQKEHILRQQLKAIQKELGEGEEGAAEIEELRTSLQKAGLPEDTEKQILKDLKRLERTPEASAEHAMLRTYLETMAELPWTVADAPDIDITAAKRILDEDHYGLQKVKRRILEYLAVLKLAPKGRSPILCFVGPPGVGKTSLGQSIARAMGRKFARLSLGGVHDEAEIRGHRRTYIGAMPGNIIQSIKKVNSRTCVLMLDEMDKLGAGFHGDPSSALLEVLDPEQNVSFRDNYLGVPFDLSRVVFIATANVLDNVPAPLRDRMEVVELPGYTEEEKAAIAERYLIDRQLKANGLDKSQCDITSDAIHHIIRYYTREAGCRNLERQIGAVIRHAAVAIVEKRETKLTITADNLSDILGAPKFESEVAMRTQLPGVATGLAWTAAGGDILFIEAAQTPGKGKLILTGQLGDVMKESAQAALSLAKARAGDLGIDAGRFETSDIHIHVPAGAIPKDGPSAGVAIYVALASLLSGRCVRHDVAMTGEISLRGLVLPIGGIKEKSVAAARAGLKTVLLPKRNKKDLEEIPESARKQLEFKWLETVDEAVDHALMPCG